MPPKKVTPRGKSAPAPKAEPASKPKRPRTKKAAPKAAPKRTTATYLRNLHGIPVNFRFSEETSGRRVELRPRGERGDITKVSKDEIEDPIFMMNQDSLFELISSAETRDVLDKQTHNQQKGSPLVDMLRNELGDPIDKVTIEKPFEQQSITVAEIEQTGPTNKMQQGEVIHRGVTPKRAALPGTQDNPGPEIPDSVGPEEAADWLARNAQKEGIEGPAAGLGNLGVSIDPVQRER